MWVLVVDDDPEVRRVVRRGLEQEDCQVAEAADGDGALAIVSELFVDVAVLDRQMPGMSGLELLVELRRRSPAVHIIMLTGASAEADRVLGLASGADDYMVKPFSSRELAARVVAVRRRRTVLRGPDGGATAMTLDQSVPSQAPGAQAFLVVSEGQIVSASAAAVTLFGAASATEMTGQDVLSFIGEHALAAIKPAQEPELQTGWSVPELIALDRDGGRGVQVLVASSPSVWEGRPATKVSLWEQTDSAVQAAVPLSAVTEDAEAVVVLDAQTRIQALNPAAERLYGWHEKEVHGRPLSEAMGSAMTTSDLDAFRATVGLDGHWDGEVDHRRRDGSTVRVRSSGSALRAHSGQPAGVVLVNRELQGAGAAGARPGDEAELSDDIYRGLAERRFVVYYQPIVRLRDASIIGVEALVRWQHPQRGLLEPAVFIDTAERSGAIIELGAFVLDEARAQWTSWHQAGQSLYVSVNLSGLQLADPNLPALIAAKPLPEGELWLEVTETSLVRDLAQAGDTLNQVTALGPKVSIDDFGTGWASMTYLREFPVHALKIDRSFVRGIGTSSVDTAISTSVLSLGRELGLKVFAEGIETRGQHARLRDLGCEYGQGYLFGRPAPPGELALKAP